MRRFLDEFAEPWEEVRAEVDEFIEVGEHVVTPLTNYHRGRQGIEVQVRPCHMWTLRGGKVVRVCFYQKRHEALEAAGLHGARLGRR